MLSSIASAGVVVFIMLACVVLMRWNRKLSKQSTDVHRKLTTQQACDIYKRKIDFLKSIRTASRRERSMEIKNECAALGVRYRVSPRTILDVWNRKTMVIATSHLWDAEHQ
jgi:hypothetical protein